MHQNLKPELHAFLSIILSPDIVSKKSTKGENRPPKPSQQITHRKPPNRYPTHKNMTSPQRHRLENIRTPAHTAINSDRNPGPGGRRTLS